MSRDERLAQLRADVKRWRGRLSEAESTYCQGVANKAAKHFEALIKQLAEQRVAVKGWDLGSLLAEGKYGGGAQTIDKLPLGTATQLVIRLTHYDIDLAEACPSEVRRALTRIVNLRNETTHELAPERMRASTDGPSTSLSTCWIRMHSRLSSEHTYPAHCPRTSDAEH